MCKPKAAAEPMRPGANAQHAAVALRAQPHASNRGMSQAAHAIAIAAARAMSHVTAASQAQDIAISTAVTDPRGSQATTGILRSAVIASCGGSAIQPWNVLFFIRFSW